MSSVVYDMQQVKASATMVVPLGYVDDRGGFPPPSISPFYIGLYYYIVDHSFDWTLFNTKTAKPIAIG